MDKRKLIGYWLATIAICVLFGLGGIADLALPEEVVAEFENLGYPPYFARILGVWKVLAAVALLVPGYPRLKEWAYAGLTFDLTGASASHIAAGSSMTEAAIPIALLGVVAASHQLRPPWRKLSS